MDESVELFQAEQRRLAADGGLKQHLIAVLKSLAFLIVVMWLLMAILGVFPRNTDHSMKVVYYGPVLGVLGIIAGYLLSRPSFRKPPFRATLWTLIFLALAMIPVGTIDVFLRNGS